MLASGVILTPSPTRSWQGLEQVRQGTAAPMLSWAWVPGVG